MRQILDMPGNATLEELVNILARASEFTDIAIRVAEKAVSSRAIVDGLTACSQLDR
jgi:hypothetical protein